MSLLLPLPIINHLLPPVWKRWMSPKQIERLRLFPQDDILSLLRNDLWLSLAFTRVCLCVLKGTIKCNQVAVNCKHFVWPSHPRRVMAAALKCNSPSIHPEPLHFALVCFGLSHPAFIIILADVSQRQGNFEPSQMSHGEEEQLSCENVGNKKVFET